MSKDKTIKQVWPQLKDRLPELTALLKKRTRKKTAYTFALLHQTASLSETSLRAGRLIRRDHGLRFFILRNKVPVATVDFLKQKNKFVFSHFTTGQKVKDLYKQMNSISIVYGFKRIGIAWELLKVYALGKSFVAFKPSGYLSLIQITGTQDSEVLLSKKQFLLMVKKEVAELQKEEKRFCNQKIRNVKDRIENLSHLDYL